MKVLMFLKVDPNLDLAVCVPYKVNCKHIFTIQLVNDNDDDHHHNSLQWIEFGNNLYLWKAGSETWRYLLGGQTPSDLQQVVVVYLYLLYLLGGQTPSHLQ